MLASRLVVRVVFVTCILSWVWVWVWGWVWRRGRDCVIELRSIRSAVGDQSNSASLSSPLLLRVL
jgi:hypothetical protein